MLKMKFDEDEKLNLNMGRLLAHEVGHALGANHDDGISIGPGRIKSSFHQFPPFFAFQNVK